MHQTEKFEKLAALKRLGLPEELAIVVSFFRRPRWWIGQSAGISRLRRPLV
jgi:hypothetical protein